MDRRSFLRRAAFATGGLLVGDEALALFERLTHRRIFALGGIPQLPFDPRDPSTWTAGTGAITYLALVNDWSGETVALGPWHGWRSLSEWR